MKTSLNFQRLAQLREDRDWSRREVIFKLHDLQIDVSEGTLANWENGDTTPNIHELLGLSKIYGIPLNHLLHDASPTA